MYQQKVLAFLTEAQPIFGVPYGIYLKHLRGRSATADDEQSARR